MKHLLALSLALACSSPQKQSASSKNVTTSLSPTKPLEPPDGQPIDVRQAPGSINDQDEDGLHVIGAIPKDSIHRVVRENFTSIRQCYEQLVMANPGLQGKVIAKFTVGLDGTVAVASATGVHPDLETCVATQIRKFKFPRPDGVKGDVVVEYPFVFKPG